MTRPGASVVVVADDLIWASRILEAVRRAGAEAVRLGSQAEVEVAAAASVADERPDPVPRGAVVDVNGRRYDGVAAIERLHAVGVPVIAVAQHDDLDTRRRALAAGATRVFSYNKFFTDGPRLVEGWLGADAGPDTAAVRPG